MRNIALLLRFDGTNYHGWQTQKTEATVCRTVERAIEKTVGHPVSLHGCGRTDAGVHAERYVANFRTDSRIPAEKLPFALNARLPSDIAARAAAEVPEAFDSIGSLEKKEYTYRIHTGRHRDPFLINRAYFYPHELDLSVLNKAASMFVGTKDFSSVRSAGSSTRSTVRTVYYFRAESVNGLVEFKVCADGFLYNMVRAMVGTVLYASREKLSADDIPGLLRARDRNLAGPTAPACGLYMTRLWYGKEVSVQWLSQ